MRYKVGAKCVARNHLVKNRWRRSSRNIFFYAVSLYFFWKRYNGWGIRAGASRCHRLFFQANARGGEPNHWRDSSAFPFRTQSLFSFILKPFGVLRPTHSTSVRHLTQTMHLNIEPMNLIATTASTINPLSQRTRFKEAKSDAGSSSCSVHAFVK